MESQVETKLADKSHEESQVETKVAQEAIPSSLNTNAPGPMVSKEETSLLEDDSLQKTLEPIIDFFQKFPEQAIKILQVYKKPLVYLGLILSSIIAVYLTLTVLVAIDRIPLFAPFFELVGIAYSFWFVKRYLINDSDRQELGSELNSLKTKILGKTEANSEDS